MEKTYEIRSEYHHLKQRRIDLAIYRPITSSERAEIAVLALHNSNYMSFPPAVELAKKGFLTAGAFLPPQHKDVEEWLADFKALVEYMRHQPGGKETGAHGPLPGWLYDQLLPVYRREWLRPLFESGSNHSLPGSGRAASGRWTDAAGR